MARGPVAFEDPDRAADAIIARVGKTIELALPLGLGKANHVANALFARAASTRYGTADPGPPQIGTVPGLQCTTSP